MIFTAAAFSMRDLLAVIAYGLVPRLRNDTCKYIQERAKCKEVYRGRQPAVRALTISFHKVLWLRQSAAQLLVHGWLKNKAGTAIAVAVCSAPRSPTTF
jgi:hypothetical protein